MSDMLLQAVVDELRLATGNLPPALIVKAMQVVADCDYLDLGADGFTNDEITALRAATFEVLRCPGGNGEQPPSQP